MVQFSVREQVGHASRLGVVVFLLLALLLLNGGACSSPTSPVVAQPTPVPNNLGDGLLNSYLGIWSGTAVDSAAGSGSIVITFTQTVPQGLSGTWSATFPSASVGGVVQATESALPTFFVGCATNQTAIFQLTKAGNRLSGTYNAIICPGLTSGSIDVTLR